jgi:hypothetical protein
MNDIVLAVKSAELAYMKAVSDLSEVGEELRFQIEKNTILTDADTFSQLRELQRYTIQSATDHQTVRSQLAQLYNKLNQSPYMVPAKRTIPYLVRVK